MTAMLPPITTTPTDRQITTHTGQVARATTMGRRTTTPMDRRTTTTTDRRTTTATDRRTTTNMDRPMTMLTGQAIMIHTAVVIDRLAKPRAMGQPKETIPDPVPNKARIGLTRVLVLQHRKQDIIWWV